MAAQRQADYTAGSDRIATLTAGSDRIATLTGAVDRFLAITLDELDEPSIRCEAATLERLRRRFDARLARATDALAERQARRAAQANPDDPGRARQRARQEVRNGLADELGWTKGQAKQNEQLGQALNRGDDLADAADQGEIPAANATRMAQLWQRTSPRQRAEVEPELLEAARTQDPVTFGKTVDRLRGRLNPDEAEKTETLRHQRRRGSVTETPEGMTRVFSEHAGVEGSIVARGIDAYRRMDAPGEGRSPGQRTADAIVDMARAALNHLHGSTETGDDPTPDGDADGDTPASASDGDTTPKDVASPRRPERNHRVRPHIVVTIPIDVLLARAGMVEVDGSPVPLHAIRHLMDDAGWAFVVTETHGKPLVVTGESRTVPTSLWRALVLRDGGCIYDGCDARPDWCDVMHLTVPYRDGGRLTQDNAALGCRWHHRAYDGDPDRHQLDWEDGRPTLRPKRTSPDPRAGPGPGP